MKVLIAIHDLIFASKVRETARLIHWGDASHLSPALRAEAYE